MALRRRGLLASAAAAALLVGVSMPTSAKPDKGERSLTIYNIHTKETVTAVFKRNGQYVQDGLEKLNHIMRDYRRNEATKMDPELFDLLWQIHTELGSKAPIHLVSGYRSQATNEMLRRTVGGQASKSRHILGKAADVHFPDIPLKQLRYSALIQERGGVGYYPTSALPFVHVDTDRVRSWPRLPRYELALLFPAGSTRHAPAEGGPITREDVRIAKAKHGVMAQQIAMFLDHRGTGGTTTAVADAGSEIPDRSAPQRVATLPRAIEPAAPPLVERPRLVSRLQQPIMPVSLRASASPSSGDRARLAELASIAATLPQLVSGPVRARRPEGQSLPSLTGASLPAPPAPAARTSLPERQVASLGPAALSPTSLTDSGRFDWGGWISAPAFDEEHPEELSYRPFPIAPYLTESEGAPLMSELIAVDAARTLDLLDQPESAAMLRFRPATRTAELLWSQQFTGTAIKLDALRDEPPGTVPSLTSKSVRTSQR
ncbi:MAG: DUF882 domain-containing protein [Hyphomicrobiaceae bacterium]